MSRDTSYRYANFDFIFDKGARRERGEERICEICEVLFHVEQKNNARTICLECSDYANASNVPRFDDELVFE